MGMADHDRVEVQYEQVEGGADGTQAEAVHHEPIEGGAEEHQPETFSSLTFADDNGCELTFKLKRNAELGRAMETFAMWAGKDRDVLRFLFEGERLLDNTTMEMVSFTYGPTCHMVLPLTLCHRSAWRMGTAWI